MTRSVLEKRFPYALVGFLGGVLIFLYLYGTAVLNPAFDGWIFSGYDETDIWQHYAGWNLFRNSDWAFPLGFASNIHYPDGSTITYTDSVPWVSIFFKLFRSVLPATFQWFGLYTLLCFGLQGAAGALLGTRHGKPGWGKLLLALGCGVLFACIPSLWERAFRHVALSSQYLVLFGLYGYLEARDRFLQGRTGVPLLISLMALLSIGIHPYYLPMVMMCAAVSAVDCLRYTRKWGAAAMQFAIPVCAGLLGGILTGAFASNGSMSRWGYGLYSMNLNAIFNPMSVGNYDWSKVFPQIPHISPTQNDGFNYLGLGILLLLAVSVLFSLCSACRNPKAAKTWWLRNWVLFCGCLFMTGFAVSYDIYFGQYLLHLPMPAFLINLCGIFRASGRMFYFVSACIVLYGINQMRRLQTRSRGSVLVALCFLLVISIQLWDTGNTAAAKRAYFQAPIPTAVANDPLLVGLGETHHTLIYITDNEDDQVVYHNRLLAILAGKEGMATNMYLSVQGGNYPQAAALSAEAAEGLRQGSYDESCVYATGSREEWEIWQSVFAHDSKVQLLESHNIYFLIP